MNKHTKPTLGALFKTLLTVSALSIFLTGCAGFESPVTTEEKVVPSLDGLNLNVKYAESYDQTTITYSREWPGSIATGLQKEASGSGEILIDYERVHEVVTFDEEGYMSTSLEFLEGDSEMGMPESLYNELKESMPSHSYDHDPLVKIIASNGIETGYGKSGAVLYEFEYNPDEFKVDLTLLDDSDQTSNSSTEQSIQQNISRLEADGLNYDLVEGVYAKYQLPASQELKKEGVGLFQEVMDLRSGEIIASSIQDIEGKYLEVVERNFQSIDGSSIMNGEIRYNFGMIDGQWDITTRTVMSRENIQIKKN